LSDQYAQCVVTAGMKRSGLSVGETPARLLTTRKLTRPSLASNGMTSAFAGWV
jgi:hypothetical protein